MNKEQITELKEMVSAMFDDELESNKVDYCLEQINKHKVLQNYWNFLCRSEQVLDKSLAPKAVLDSSSVASKVLAQIKLEDAAKISKDSTVSLIEKVKSMFFPSRKWVSGVMTGAMSVFVGVLIYQSNDIDSTIPQINVTKSSLTEAVDFYEDTIERSSQPTTDDNFEIPTDLGTSAKAVPVSLSLPAAEEEDDTEQEEDKFIYPYPDNSN